MSGHMLLLDVMLAAQRAIGGGAEMMEVAGIFELRGLSARAAPRASEI